MNPSALSSTIALTGLHHVTAIAGDPRRNVDFYTRVLGLRLIKRTVNFDDPSTYHLYYGDSVGTPGSVLTFFPWAGIRRGRPGTGQAYATAFSVPAGSLAFWRARLIAHGVSPGADTTRFGDEVISFTDPDGLALELIASAEPDSRAAHSHSEISAAHGIRGFHSVTLALSEATPTASLLTHAMGYRIKVTTDNRTRFSVAGAGPGTYVDLLVDPKLPRGVSGAGTVHHIAFRTPDDATQALALEALQALDLGVSPVMDRNYFHSIYYREPAGILFEIATDNPGFMIDEPLATLGTALKLPAQYESQRVAIEAHLPPLL
ncbi:MAG: ring-cleaving dioxygenase [Opitutaceae bacterium]